MKNFAIKPLPAMLWELWRTSRWELLMRVSVVLCGLLLLCAVSSSFDEFQMQVIRALVFAMAMALSVFSSSWMIDIDTGNTGFKFRLGFTRPLSNLQLVSVPMAYSVATSMLFYVACCWLTRTLLNYEMPVVAPAILVVASVCVLSCVTWASTNPIEKLIGIFVIFLSLVAGVSYVSQLRSSGEPILLKIGRPDFLELDWYIYPIVAIVCVVSLRITVFAVGKQRFGEGFSWSAIPLSWVRYLLESPWVVSVGAWLKHRTRPAFLRGPILAQIWLDIRRTVGIQFFAVVLTAAIMAFVVLVPFVNPSWGGAHSPRLWLGAIVLSPILYQMLAIEPTIGLRQREGKVYLSLFDATRPLRCDQLVAIKLLVIAFVSTVGCLLLVASAATHAALANQWAEWAQLQHQLVEGMRQIATSGIVGDTLFEIPSAIQGLSWTWWFAALAALLVGYFASASIWIVAVLWLPKNKSALTILSLLLLVHMGVFAWDASHGMPLRNLWQAYGYLLPGFAILLSLQQLRMAYLAGYLSGKYFAVVLCFWLLFVGLNAIVISSAFDMMSGMVVHPMIVLDLVASLLVPLAFAAKAPLALASFRHA